MPASVFLLTNDVNSFKKVSRDLTIFLDNACSLGSGTLMDLSYLL